MLELEVLPRLERVSSKISLFSLYFVPSRLHATVRMVVQLDLYRRIEDQGPDNICSIRTGITHSDHDGPPMATCLLVY